MKIFPSSSIKKLDAYTIEHEPIASIDLMERAATALTKAIMNRWSRETPVTVFAGPGNIGGDALAVARMLAEKEYKETNPLKVFEEVYHIILDRKEHPKEGSYTNYLFDKGIDKILKKLGEEATEIIIAAKNPDPEEIKYEISDFLYHMMVLMADKGVTWEEITEELANR